ncbi:MAG: hypothetical protein H6731_09975 [Myxococcales bacterium]|nr:MAG: hypothetical protein H6731_09975 [Myxococcales bacterium]
MKFYEEINKNIKLMAYLLVFGILTMSDKLLFFIASFNLIFIMSACQGEIDAKHLPTPEGVLTEPSVDATTQLLKDYAQIELNDSIPGGPSINIATDAQELEKLLTIPSKNIFISLPESKHEKRQLNHSIEAAFMRLQRPTAKNKQKLHFVNLEKLYKIDNLFHLSPKKQQKYYINTAEKFNKNFSQNDLVVVDIDNLPESVDYVEFVQKFTGPKLIVLSSKAKKFISFPSSETKDKLFFPRGLTGKHIFYLIQKHFSQAQNQTIKKNATQLALMCSQIFTALYPKSDLEMLDLFFKKIEGLLDSAHSGVNYHDALKARAADTLQANISFIDSLELSKLGLDAIQKRVDIDPQAFSQATAAFDARLKQNEKKTRDQFFLARNLKLIIERIIQRSEGIGDNANLSDNHLQRIDNAVSEAMKAFMLGGNGKLVALKASEGFARSLSLISLAANGATVTAIRNSKKLIDLINELNN